MIHFKCEMSVRRSLYVIAAASMLLVAAPGRAATLEHKWRTGEQLTYSLALDGTMTIETDATAPILFAGIPLDVKITGGADMLLDTRTVAPDGAATIALSLPQLKLKGTAWEQVATLDAKQGSVGITFNGRGLGKNTPVPWLVDPTLAVQVSKIAHVERIVSLVPPVEEPAADDQMANDPLREQAAPATPAPPPGLASKLPINVAGLMRSMALQLLPTLWPGHDVAPGDTWSVESRLPVPTRNADVGPALEMLSIGKFDLELVDEEIIDGRPVYKVSIKGLLDLDKAKAARLNSGEGTRLNNATQKVNGFLWFDSEAGQLARADLRLIGNMAGIIAMPQRNPGDTPTPFAANQKFDGTLKLLLKSAKMKTGPLAVLPE